MTKRIEKNMNEIQNELKDHDSLKWMKLKMNENQMKFKIEWKSNEVQNWMKIKRSLKLNDNKKNEW